MGHGCHTCGCPNGCECVCEYCDKRAPYGCDCPAAQQARQAKHFHTIAAIAAALPIDLEMDDRVSRAMNRPVEGQKSWPLMRLSEPDVEAVKWVLLVLREDVEPGSDEHDTYYNAIAFFERILARYVKS